MDDHGDDMFCPSCGERMNRADRFCRHCGVPNEKGGWGPTSQTPSAQDGASGYDDESWKGPRRRGDDPKGRPGRGREPADGWSESTRRGWSESTHRGWNQSSPHGERRPVDSGYGPAQSDSEQSVQWRAYLPPHARAPGESPYRVVGVAIGLGLLGFLLLGVFTLIVSGIGIAAGLSLPVVILVGTVIGQYVGFAGLSLWYLRRRGLDWNRIKAYLGIRRPTLKEIGIIFAAWLVIMLGIVALGFLAELVASLLGTEIGDAEQEATELFADNPEYVPAAILVMFLVVGPCEEILFRGVIQGRLRERFSPTVAIGIASVFFAIIHVFGFIGSIDGIILGLSVLGVAGVVLGVVYEYTQNLVVVSLLHGFYNSVVILIIYITETTDFEEAVLMDLLFALPL